MAGLISGFLSIFGCNSKSGSNSNQNSPTIQVAKQITISKLQEELQKLKDGKTEYDFIGITSNGIDCIYFVKEGDKFQIEFEAMSEEQIPFIVILNEFAGSNGFKSIMTSYGNKPSYSSTENAPVIRILTNSNLLKSAEIGETIQKTIFKNTAKTVYDVVP